MPYTTIHPEVQFKFVGKLASCPNTARQGSVVNDTFAHNTRSELVEATVNNTEYQYGYDNIGNRLSSTEGDNTTTYMSNNLNQYTSIQEASEATFTPQFDADGNQILIKTETGIWSATYNAENRPVTFTNSESNTVVECAYDSMGRRAYKKVSVNGEVTLHQRYIYRGYLQIACIDLTRTAHPALWYITWDPSEPVATRPLAIQKDGTWYTFGFDVTKNTCEVFTSNGYIGTTYSYSPFGCVFHSGNLEQPIRWCSEICDEELSLVYYNYRFYNPYSGMWLSRDQIFEQGGINLYNIGNSILSYDILGLSVPTKVTRYMLYRMILENATSKLNRKELVKRIREIKDFYKNFELHHMCSKANVKRLKTELNLTESVDCLDNLISLPTPQGKAIIDDWVEQGLLAPRMSKLPVHRGYRKWHRNADADGFIQLMNSKSISAVGSSMRKDLFNGKYRAVMPIVIMGSDQTFAKETNDYCEDDLEIMDALAQYIEELDKYERKLARYEWELKSHEETIATMKKYSTDNAKVSTYWDNSVTRFFDDWINPVSIVELSIDLGTAIHAPTPPDEPIIPEILKQHIE